MAYLFFIGASSFLLALLIAVIFFGVGGEPDVTVSGFVVAVSGRLNEGPWKTFSD